MLYGLRHVQSCAARPSDRTEPIAFLAQPLASFFVVEGMKLTIVQKQGDRPEHQPRGGLGREHLDGETGCSANVGEIWKQARLNQSVNQSSKPQGLGQNFLTGANVSTVANFSTKILPAKIFRGLSS